MKYKLISRDIPGYGKVGDVIDVDDISEVPFNSTLELIGKDKDNIDQGEEKKEEELIPNDKSMARKRSRNKGRPE